MNPSLKLYRLEKPFQGNKIPDEMQFGFQKTHSCIMTSCTLELVIEINTCQKHTTYVALLVAEKVFDKVCHEGLFFKVDQTNIDPKHAALLRSLYENLESRVLWADKISETIPIHQGVRQGGVLSPLLYTIFFFFFFLFMCFIGSFIITMHICNLQL